LKTIKLDESSPIGLHIRKRRLALNLTQKAVALKINVSTDCVTFWENGRAKPQIQHMPKIIEFLGYNPVTYENLTIGGRIKNYRIQHGLSHKKMGKMLEVDGATICTWEIGKFIPKGRNLTRLNALLNN
jgi:DNA-binding XRE family transcriptional regulator